VQIQIRQERIFKVIIGWLTIIEINPTRIKFPSIKLYYQMPISVRLGSMVFRVSVVYDNESPSLRNTNIRIIIYTTWTATVATERVIIKNAATSSGAEI